VLGVAVERWAHACSPEPLREGLIGRLGREDMGEACNWGCGARRGWKRLAKYVVDFVVDIDIGYRAPEA
jgi:hypothetical protein